MAILLYKNIHIHYSVKGNGSAVVLLHGFLENINMWKGLIPQLAKRNKVICIDLFGHGKTDNLSYCHEMEEQAKMVKFVLNHLKLRRYTFIGHSMGGYITLAFAELFPNNIKGICLMNSTALPDTEEKKIIRDRGITAVKYNSEFFIKMAIPNLFSEENKDKFVLEINQITYEALQISKQGIIAAMEGMKIRKNRANIYNTSNYPIVMVIGRQDPALDYNSLIDQTKNTAVEIIEFADGHMSHIENKEELINTLKKFAKLCR